MLPQCELTRVVRGRESKQELRIYAREQGDED